MDWTIVNSLPSKRGKMSSKEQAHSSEKTTLKQRPPQPSIQDFDVQVESPFPVDAHGTLVAAESLAPRDVLRLQRVVGNQVVSRSLAHPVVQRAPFFDDWSACYVAMTDEAKKGYDQFATLQGVDKAELIRDKACKDRKSGKYDKAKADSIWVGLTERSYCIMTPISRSGSLTYSPSPKGSLAGPYHSPGWRKLSSEPVDEWLDHPKVTSGVGEAGTSVGKEVGGGSCVSTGCSVGITVGVVVEPHPTAISKVLLARRMCIHRFVNFMFLPLFTQIADPITQP